MIALFLSEIRYVLAILLIFSKALLENFSFELCGFNDLNVKRFKFWVMGCTKYPTKHDSLWIV